MRGHISKVWVTGGTVMFAIGLALRCTIRDRFDGWSLIYYATPWPVLAGLALVIGLLHGIGRRRWLAAGFTLTGVASAASWYAECVVRNGELGMTAHFRVVSWNAEHAKRHLPEVIEAARGFNGDILGITETESTKPEDASRWKAAFPKYSIQTLPGFMLFITRGEILETFDGDLRGSGRYNAIKVRLKGRTIMVLLVEFDANPLRSRRPAFEALKALLRKYAGHHTVVMGDFNTPRDSLYFFDLRGSMTHAFEAAGNGLADTWPAACPVLSLDHIWTTQTLRPIRCTLEWGWYADHRAVVADFVFDSGPW